MGRVIPSNEIRAGLVSMSPRHLEAGEFALQDLMATVVDGEPIFKSAGVYGSTIDGPGPSVRSDLDMVAIHYPDAEIENAARRKREALTETIKRDFQVSLEAQLYPSGGLLEKIDPLYAQHIVDIGATLPRWHINNPGQEFNAYLLSPDDLEGRLVHACRYLILKALDFDSAIDNYVGFADYRVMQRALELPSAIGRKVLPATKMPSETLPPISDKAAMRRLVEDKIVLHFGEDEGRTILGDQKGLAAIDSEYTSLLNGTLSDREALERALMAESERNRAMNRLRDRYDSWIEDHYLEACERAERLSRAWSNLFENKLAIAAPHRFHDIEEVEKGLYYNASDYS